MAITIKDIAKIAGVSHSTVSRSLNDNPRISKATRERIKKIASELGFEYNSNARGLSSSNITNTIGVIFPKTFDDVVSGLFLNSIVKRVQYNIEKNNFDTIIEFAENRFNKKSNIQRLIDRKKIDGLVLTTPEITHDDYKYILSHNIPHIFLHNKPKYFSQESTIVFTDHEEGGYIATNYLIKNNHKNILTISEKAQEIEFQERCQGYERALKEHQIKIDKNLMLYCDITFYDGYNVIMENKDLLKNISAIFFQSDIIALGGIKALKELGYSIPDDISVIGYDNLELGTYYHPYLTTVHQPKNEIVDIAIEKLFHFINTKEQIKKEEIIAAPTLVIRESVKKI
jgi:LacI family transcriptional regulator